MNKLVLAALSMTLCFLPARAADLTMGRALRQENIFARGGCGPYGHRGPWGGCLPGGQYGAGNYYALGPDFFGPRPYFGPPFYGEVPADAAQRDYGPRYWGALPYGIPAFW